MLKNKEFWNDIEDTVNEEHSDYVVLDLFFAMRTYLVLTINLSQLPVDEDKFNNIFDICREKTLNLLKDNYSEYTTGLQNIAKDVPEVGILMSIIRVFEFIKQHKEPLALFCAMGVLNGLEDYCTNELTLTYLQSAKKVLFNFITSL